LDDLLKYSPLVVALAYVTGFVMELGYISHLQPSFFDVDFGPRILVNGAAVLLQYGGISLAFGLAFVFMDELVRQRAGTGTVQAVLRWGRYGCLFLGPLLASIGLYKVRTSPGLPLMLSVFSGNFLLLFLMLFPAAYSRLTKLQHCAVILFLAASLGTLAFASGTWTWDISSGQGVARLLIAPEAIEGAREMGVTFPEGTGGGSARLSEQVVMLYTGTRTYTFRLNDKRVVQLTRDKVWGMTP
jgi:hypothetical protein